MLVAHVARRRTAIFLAACCATLFAAAPQAQAATCSQAYEEDHLIPLEPGGAPRDAHNLWPEPRYEAGGYTATDKDTVENSLEREVCADDMTLADARWWIVNDRRDAP